MKWGIIGTGTIAHEMAAALQRQHRAIVAVCSGHLASAEKFARDYKIDRVYASVSELVQDPEVEIVYIATPHNLHAEQIKAALAAKKHVLCEKAITINARQLDECRVLAREHHVALADGMTIFHMPLYKELKRRVDTGILGPLKMVQVNFGSLKQADLTNRFFAKDLAGGALLDIGVYAVSFARFFMQSKPDVVLTTANYFATGVDETSGIILKNPDGEMAVIALTMRAKQPKRGVVAFENGYIEIPMYPRAESAVIYYSQDGHQEQLQLGHTEQALDYEIEDMEALAQNENVQATPVLDLTTDVMAILTAIRHQWGLVYPED